MRIAMSADANGLPGGLHHMDDGAATVSSTGHPLRPSVQSASVGANSERLLSPSDVDLGLLGAKAKERNRPGVLCAAPALLAWCAAIAALHGCRRPCRATLHEIAAHVAGHCL
jgi:hypothetical protein